MKIYISMLKKDKADDAGHLFRHRPEQRTNKTGKRPAAGPR